MERLASFALFRTRTTLFLLALVTAWAAAGLPRLTTVVGYRGALSEDHPAIERLDRFIADFGGGLPVAAVWSCDGAETCSSVFDESSLRMALAVEERLASNPLIRRIDSPATSPLFVSSDGGFAVRRFFEDGSLAADREALEKRALEDPLWRGNLVSPDGKVGAIILQLTSSESETTVAVVPALQDALRPFEEKGYRFHLVGDPVDFAIAGGELEKETPRIVPVMVGLIAVTLYWLFRSARVTLAALVTTGIALLWAMGSMGWLGWAQSEVTQALPPQILVIGVCDTIHVLGLYATRRRARPMDTVEDRSATLVRVARDVGPACVITAVTTALGFLSFSTTGFDLFSRFGVTAAVGAIAALLLTFTLFPILLVRLPSRGIRAERASDAWHQALELVVVTCRRRGKGILIVAAVLGLLGLVGAFRLQVDVDERTLFGAESEVVRWAEFVEDRLRRTDTLEIGIELPPTLTIVDPSVMQGLSDVAGHLAMLEGFGRVRSILEPVGRLHRVLRDDDPGFERAADTSAGNAQLLMALRLEAGGRLDEWVTPDLRRARLSVEVDSAAQNRRGEMLAAVRSYLDRRLPEGFRYELTGPFALYYDFVDEIQSSQVSSFASAAVGIFAVFVFFLWWTGSTPREALALGSLGMLPNVLPVVCTLGSMGLWGIQLDVGTAMVAAIVLGISTDDTVHVVSHFRDQRKLGLSDPEAMAVTIRQVGRAAISTGVALSLGFFALTLSSWQSIASFGLLSGIAILAALVAELFLLPSLVMGFGKERPPAEEPAVSRGLARIGRQTLTWAAILVVGAVLAMMSTEQLRDREVARLSCWAFPNGYVPLGGALDRSCPLRPGDRLELLQAGGRIWRVSDPGEIDAALATPGEEVQARVVRRGETLWLSIPVLRESEATGALHLLAAGLTAVGTLGGVLLLLWYSSAAAAAPLAALYVCLIVMAVYLLTGLSHRVSPVPYLLAVGMAPAAAAHLALAFPHPRSLLVRVPGVARALYAAGALNAAILTYGYARYTELLAMGEWLTFSLGLGLLAAFLVGSLLPGSQAASALERERGRAAIVGALAVLFAAAAALAAFPRLLPGSVPWILAGAVLAIPVPIGFALARYQLNDLRPHMRQLAVGGLVRVLYVGGLAALLVAVAERSGDALHSEPVAVLGMFAGVVFVSALVGERAARAVGRLIPTVDARLRALERSHAVRASELQSGEEAAQLAADTMAQGLAATGISIFVPAPLGWRLAVERGSGAVTEPALADRAAAMLADEDSPLRFSIEGGGEGASADRLRALGVELVVPFRSRGDLTAIAFVCASEDGLPYTLPEIAFVRRVSARAATAIHNGRLAEDLLRAERFAAVGRVAAGLAHDVGKPMSVIHERARMMSDTEAYPHQVREDARSVAGLADEALAAIDRLFMESRRGSAPASTRSGLAEVVARAVLIASKLHAPERVEVRIEPDLPAVSHGADLTRVLTNLLDNALLADREGIVRLNVSRQDQRVCLEVVDRGCGMDDETLARALEPFFTTRRSEGGRGIGLSASRALVEAMGGTLELESSPGEGTRARIWLVPEGPKC